MKTKRGTCADLQRMEFMSQDVTSLLFSASTKTWDFFEREVLCIYVDLSWESIFYTILEITDE